MKQIKFISMLLLATIFLGFTACSDDDENDNNGILTGRKLLKIEPKDPNYDETTIYSYSKDGLQGWSYNNSDGYSDDRIDLKLTSKTSSEVIFDGIVERHKSKQIYKLNKQGLVTSQETTSQEGFEYTITFEYSNGYLISSVMDSEEGTKTVNLTYSNGNITECEVVNQSNNRESKRTYQFAYNDTQNKGSILSDKIQGEVFFSAHGAFRLGIFGKATTNLVSKCTITDNYGYQETITYTYTYDDDGYVKTVSDSDGGKFTYTFE